MWTSFPVSLIFSIQWLHHIYPALAVTLVRFQEEEELIVWVKLPCLTGRNDDLGICPALAENGHGIGQYRRGCGRSVDKLSQWTPWEGRHRQRDLKSHLWRLVTGLYFCLKGVGAGPGVFSSKVSDLEAKEKETQPSSLAGHQWLKARSFLMLWLNLPSFPGICVIYTRPSLRQQLPLCSPSRASGCSQTPFEERQNSAFHRT